MECGADNTTFAPHFDFPDIVSTTETDSDLSRATSTMARASLGEPTVGRATPT